MALDDALINPPWSALWSSALISRFDTPCPVYGRKYGMPFTRSCAIYLLSLSLWRKTLFEKRHRDPETSNCVIAYNRKYKAVKIDRLASIFYLCEYNRSELRFSPRERWRRVLTLDRMRQKKKRKKERKKNETRQDKRHFFLFLSSTGSSRVLRHLI